MSFLARTRRAERLDLRCLLAPNFIANSSSFPSLSNLWLSSRRQKSSEADFGFKNVPKEDKEHMVKNIFSKVAEKYDVMNDVMSVGAHRYVKTPRCFTVH